MQIILTEDVPNLGDMGDLVDVAPGYGRNYLIPQGLALPASGGNAKQLEHQIAIIERKKEQQRVEARKIVGEIDGVSVTIPMRTGDGDRLYGSVTNRDIAASLDAQNVKVNRKQIRLDRAISELGIYEVPIKLASGIFATIRVWVVAM
jgi:large subunit ribosomal protein L9